MLNSNKIENTNTLHSASSVKSLDILFTLFQKSLLWMCTLTYSALQNPPFMKVVNKIFSYPVGI